MVTTYFITGANRGIGYSIVEQLSHDSNNKIIASVRDASRATDLAKLAKSNKQVHIVTLDVGVESSIEGIDSQLSEITDTIDVFISNAGVVAESGPVLESSRKGWLDNFTINTVGPILLVQKLYKYLAKSELKQVVFVSSIAGAFSSPFKLPVSSYGTSKTALNFVSSLLATELKDEGFIFVSVHPGVVLSDMGNNFVDKLSKTDPATANHVKDSLAISPADSAKALVSVIEKIDATYSGKFYNYDGTELQY